MQLAFRTRRCRVFIERNCSMKIRHLLGIFLASCLNMRGEETNVFHPNMSVEKLALLPNPTTNRTPVDIAVLRTKLDDLLIHSLHLHGALTNLLTRAENYSTPLSTNEKSSASATLRLHDAARTVSLYHAHYQQMFGRNGLKADAKNVVENALLYTLRKMEWVSRRKESPRDDYFYSYFYTLLRYREVRDGWLILNGTFTQVPTERN